MKKTILFLLLLVLISGCSSSRNSASAEERYANIIELISEHESFSSSSAYFDISVEMAKINTGYRYYITVDNPRVAMYDIELLAIEKDVDYHNNMAANVGVFEETQYNMVPNQSYVEKGFVKGIVASGLSQNADTTLYIFVQFKNADYSLNHTEYLQLDVRYEDQQY